MANKPTPSGSDDDLDFDHESPDLEDPQVDPPTPAKPPADQHSGQDDYPPYNTRP